MYLGEPYDIDKFWYFKDEKESMQKLHNQHCVNCEHCNENTKRILLDSDWGLEDTTHLNTVCFPLQLAAYEYHYSDYWDIDKEKQEVSRCRFKPTEMANDND